MFKMKKLAYFSLLGLIVLGSIVSCQKEQPTPQSPQTEANVPRNAVWVTPNGKVIPYSERANWKEYVKEHFTEEKELAKIGSRACQTTAIVCGLECVKRVGNDCSKESACAPCMNCCDPVVGK